MSPLFLEGGCLCGAVRYRLLSEPYDAGYCHCSLCRRSTGAPVVAFATVPVQDLIWTAGEPQRRHSTDFGERWFCGACGTQLAMRVEHQPGTIDFTIASLDTPDEVRPQFHIFFADHVSWFDTGDDSPRHAGFRPDTPGLRQSG